MQKEKTSVALGCLMKTNKVYTFLHFGVPCPISVIKGFERYGYWLNSIQVLYLFQARK